MTLPSATGIDRFAPLRQRLSGIVALPTEQGYELAAPLNTALTSRPAAVVRVVDAVDVVFAVRFAAAHGLTVAVQATGHGAVPHGNDVLVVHTGSLQDCHIDVDRRVARVGAGVRASTLVHAAAAHGLAALTGTSSSVGVVGYLSGGGVGPLASTYGLSADYVRAIDVVTGDGVLRHVSADCDADLFWALRGGRACLGVITAVELELVQLDSVYGGELVFAAPDAAEVLHTWGSWSAELSADITTSAELRHLPLLPSVPPALAGRFSLSVRIADVGDDDHALAQVAMIRRAGNPVLDSVHRRSYADFMAQCDGPNEAAPIYSRHALIQRLPRGGIDALLTAAGPSSGHSIASVELRRLGGAFAQDANSSAAVDFRNAPYALNTLDVLATDEATVRGRVDGVYTALSPWTHPGALRNFIDSSDPTEIARAYTDSTRERLQGLASRFDPDGLFVVAGEITKS